MTTTHTPTPWYLTTTTDPYKFPIIVSRPGPALPNDGIRLINVVRFPSGDSHAITNAAFIVRACNAHDELVAALRAIVPYLEDGAGEGDDALTLLPIARAALAKVQQ